MSVSPVSVQPGRFLHEAAVYDSDDDLVDVVAPCLEASAAADDPSVVVLNEHEVDVVRDVLGRVGNVHFLPGLTASDRPAAVIGRLTATFDRLVARGAERVCFVNSVPHPGVGAAWDGWRRYEAAANVLFRDLPVRAICLYDRRATPADVLLDVERTHPRLATHAGDGHAGADIRGDHPGYLDPAAFLLSLAPEHDPLEAASPVVEVIEPTTAAARRVVREAAAGAGLLRAQVDELIIAVSEVVTNAMLHGLPPVTMKVWSSSDRVVLTVHDHGRGPSDPYVGLVPPSRAGTGQGGYGLWIVDQLVPVSYVRHDGFTVRLVGGRPLP